MCILGEREVFLKFLFYGKSVLTEDYREILCTLKGILDQVSGLTFFLSLHLRLFCN